MPAPDRDSTFLATATRVHVTILNDCVGAGASITRCDDDRRQAAVLFGQNVPVLTARSRVQRRQQVHTVASDKRHEADGPSK